MPVESPSQPFWAWRRRKANGSQRVTQSVSSLITRVFVEQPLASPGSAKKYSFKKNVGTFFLVYISVVVGIDIEEIYLNARQIKRQRHQENPATHLWKFSLPRSLTLVHMMLLLIHQCQQVSDNDCGSSHNTVSSILSAQRQEPQEHPRHQLMAIDIDPICITIFFSQFFLLVFFLCFFAVRIVSVQ